MSGSEHGAADARRGQSRRGSLAEAAVGVAVGYGVALGGQWVILPAYGLHPSLSANLQIGLWFTVLSLARSYLLRRAFEWHLCRGGARAAEAPGPGRSSVGTRGGGA